VIDLRAARRTSDTTSSWQAAGEAVQPSSGEQLDGFALLAMTKRDAVHPAARPDSVNDDDAIDLSEMKSSMQDRTMPFRSALYKSCKN
jgi:hypothetical protein